MTKMRERTSRRTKEVVVREEEVGSKVRLSTRVGMVLEVMALR